jgi:Astacin (Peptidase family M12A)
MRKYFFAVLLLLSCVVIATPSLARPQFRPRIPAGQPGRTEMRTGVYRGNPVTYAMIHGRRIFEGDIILDHVQNLAPNPPVSGQGIETLGIAYPQYFWPKNVSGVAEIPYIVSAGATNLSAALTQFNATFAGVIQFVAHNTQTDYVNFNFDPNNHNGTCDSYVGRIGGEQQTGGSIDCSLGTLLHEMGHIVGLYHEQSRPDRDSFVTISYANMIKGSKSNFDQVLDNYQELGLYDYASVMHYISYAFSRNGGPVIESIPPGIPLSNLVGYTPADIDSVKRLYGAAPTNVTIATNPPGLNVTVDGATVTTPQVYSWSLNSTHTLAIPAGAQTLAGAAYVFGRWNDSGGASHSITISPGSKTLASPATSPATTVYTANFIGLVNFTEGVYPAGSGTASASPPAQSYSGVSGLYYVQRQPVTLSASANPTYSFLLWEWPQTPLSANPNAVFVPENTASFAVSAFFSNQPVTTITTNPPGLGVYVDGGFWYGPRSFASDFDSGWTPGSSHSISTYAPQYPYSVNSRFAFSTWSDGGAMTHNITASAATYTASLTPQFAPIAYATPSCAASVTFSPTSPDGFYNQGSVVTVSSATAAGWSMTSWLNDLSGKNETQNLTVNDEELAVADYDTTRSTLQIFSLQPASLTAGSGAQPLRIWASGLTPWSIVFVNGIYRQALPMSFATTLTGNLAPASSIPGPLVYSPSHIDVGLTAADLTAPIAFPIGVSNFPPGSPCSAYSSTPFFVTSP